MSIQHNRHSDPDPTDPSRAGSAAALSVERPGDSLALVRYTFGRLPTESLVLIGLHGGTTGGHLRLDFAAALNQPRHCAQRAASWLAGPAAEPTPDAVLAAVFTDAPPAQQQHKGTRVMQQLQQILSLEYDCPLVKTWYVGAGYVRDFECTDPRCCPYPGLDAEAELASALIRCPQLDALPAASAPGHLIETFLGVPPAPSAPTEEMVSAARRCTRNAHRGTAALKQWETSLNEITAAGRCESLVNPGHAALLLRSAEDALLVQALAPLAAVGIETAQAGCRAEETEPIPSQAARQQAQQNYAAALTGTTADSPDWKRIEALDALLHLLIPYQGPHRLNLLALKGWIEWAKGSGSSATLAVDRCLQEEPEHLLGGFLSELFEASGPCPWARAKQLSHGWWRSQQPA